MRTAAIVVHGPKQMEVEQVDIPDPAPDEVLLRIAFGGICGSDLHYFANGRNGAFVVEEPLTLGHEVSGVIEAIGSDAETRLTVGTQVTVHPARPTPPPGGTEGRGLNIVPGVRYLGSAASHPHTQGGLSQYLVVKPEQLRALPDHLSLKVAALAEPMSIALHGISKAVNVGLPNARILVSGSGPIGLLALVALRARGANHVTSADVIEFPLKLAKDLGAEKTIQVGVTTVEPASYDLVIEAAGVPQSLAAALDAVKPGGTIVQLGILPSGDVPLPIVQLQSKEITLVGSQRFDVELEEALVILAEHPALEQIITDVFDLDHVHDAFAVAADPSRSSKVMISLL